LFLSAFGDADRSLSPVFGEAAGLPVSVALVSAFDGLWTSFGCLADELLSLPGVGVSVWAKAVEATMRATRTTASVLINFFIANLLHHRG